MSSSSKSRRLKIGNCLLCCHYHTTKQCPVLLGKREKQWDMWDKQNAYGVWRHGANPANPNLQLTFKPGWKKGKK